MDLCLGCQKVNILIENKAKNQYPIFYTPSIFCKSVFLMIVMKMWLLYFARRKGEILFQITTNTIKHP